MQSEASEECDRGMGNSCKNQPSQMQRVLQVLSLDEKNQSILIAEARD